MHNILLFAGLGTVHHYLIRDFKGKAIIWFMYFTIIHSLNVQFLIFSQMPRPLFNFSVEMKLTIAWALTSVSLVLFVGSSFGACCWCLQTLQSQTACHWPCWSFGAVLSWFIRAIGAWLYCCSESDGITAYIFSKDFAFAILFLSQPNDQRWSIFRVLQQLAPGEFQAHNLPAKSPSIYQLSYVHIYTIFTKQWILNNASSYGPELGKHRIMLTIMLQRLRRCIENIEKLDQCVSNRWAINLNS